MSSRSNGTSPRLSLLTATLPILCLMFGCDQLKIPGLGKADDKAPVPPLQSQTAAPTPPPVAQPATRPPAPPAPELEAQAILNEFKQLTPDQITDAHLEKLASMYPPARDQIDTLHLNSSQITEKGIALLADFPNLKLLNLSLVRLSPQGLRNINLLKNLEVLNLGQTKLDHHALEGLQTHDKLNKLYLNSISANDDLLAVVATIPHLESLSLSQNPGIDGGGFRNLQGFKNLKSLGLSQTGIVDQALPLIAKLPLEELSLANCPSITDAGLPKLAGMQELKILELRDNPQLTGKSIAKLAGLPDLFVLNVAYVPGFDDVGLKAFHKSKSLKYVNLDGSSVTEAGKQAIQKAIPDIRFELPKNRP